MIELMITVAIVAILAAIAIPSYQQHVIKTRRAAAAGCVLEMAQFMERHYTTHDLNYEGATLPTCSADVTRFYTIAADIDPPRSYTLTATPIEGGPQAKDTKCGALSINQQGVRGESGAGSVDDCW